jgi:hypothetical protein
MEHTGTLPLAEAAIGWAAKVAERDARRGYVDGFEDGVLLGLTLAKIDPTWTEQALDELFAMHERRLAERLAGTPVPPPSVAQHRMVVFAQAQEILRESE